MPEDKNKTWLENILAAEPGTDKWAEAAKETEKNFSKAFHEDQEKIAEALLDKRNAPGVSDLIVKLYNKKGVSLPALVTLAKAMNALGIEGVDDRFVRDLETWLTLCEDADATECQPADFYLLAERERQAVLDHLATWMRTDILTMLKDSAKNKEQAKAVAKAIHKAKSMGATVAESTGAAGAGFTAGGRDEFYDEAYLTPPDHTGTVFLYLYRTVFGQATMFVMLINDSRGVIKFEAYKVNRTKFDKMLESTRKNPHAMIAKVDPEFCRRMIRNAEDAGRKNNHTQHPDYLSNRRALGIADVKEGDHPVWSVLKRDEIKDERSLVVTSHELIDHRMFEDWRLFPQEEGKIVQALTEMRNSPIELTDKQKKERELELLEKETKDSLNETGRDKWRERMLTSAYLLHLFGDDQSARMAAAVGLAVEEPDSAPVFFVEIMRRTVEADMAEGEEGGSAGGPDMDRGGMVVV